jgi:hypothetical protein
MKTKTKNMPLANDATGWTASLLNEIWNLRYVTIEEPDGIRKGIDPNTEKRFSYVSKACALRNWYRLQIPCEKPIMFYGETAIDDLERIAREKNEELENEDQDWMPITFKKLPLRD